MERSASLPVRLSGRFTLLDSAPDGDSIHFIPDHPQALCPPCAPAKPSLARRTAVQGWGARALRWSPRGAITLRLEGVDALETHYVGRGGLGVLRQPPPWPERAAGALLQYLGFERVVRGPDERILSTVPAATRGAIQLERVDRYGRAVAYAFRGHLRTTTGRSGHLSPTVLASSANGYLLQQGLVYPVLYQDMAPTTLRWLHQQTQRVRAAGRGLWPLDQTHQGFTLHSVQDLQQRALIWPKLYRRLVDQMGGAGQAPLATLAQALETRVGAVCLWRQGVLVSFADLLEIDQRRHCVRLLVHPEEIAFNAD